MSIEIKTEIIINAVPEKVWQILSDFENYPNWNPFIKSITGNVAVGNKISINIQQAQAKVMVFKPTVLAFNINKELRWIGHFLFKGILDGEHQFELIANGSNATIFKHSEKFSGLLLPLFKNQLKNNTQRGFEAMNQKLKELAEQ